MQVDSDKFKRFCSASILDYLRAKQIPFETNGQKGYYHLVDHDSLVVVAEGTGHYHADTFFWNSRGLSGNLYRFITEYLGIPKGKFVDEVIATLGEGAGPKQDYASAKEQPFDETLWPDSGRHQQLTAFLSQRCGLSQAVIDRLFDLDMLHQLSNNDGALMWRNSRQKVVGASQIFNQDNERLVTRTASHSQHYYGFNFGYHYRKGDPYTLLVFEDPLRALAYYQLLSQSDDQTAYRFLSVGGSATRLPAIKNYLNDWGSSQTIRLCVDNTDAGLIMAAKLFNDYPEYQAKTEFDHPQDQFANFLQQNLAGQTTLNPQPYDDLLADYDRRHQSGAASQLIAETPGIADQGEEEPVASPQSTDTFDFDDLPF